MTVAAGSRLGPYEIVALLGAGGMGEVYRARDTRLGRDVAIKVLPAEFASEPERLKRFEQEARAVAALSHSNVLAVYDVGTHDGSPYLVTELLEGESLRERLSGGAMPVRKAVETAVQIAQGLAAAHEKGIVHRDLKPGNVFLTKDGQIKILDFGIAKLVAPKTAEELAREPTVVEATAAGTVLGTVGYMSPEQLRGLSADQRSDIFAFGCVLYEMLSGERAFAGLTAADTLSAILSKDPPILAASGREVPAALAGIVTRCLEKRPEDRFGSARDLGFALQAVVEGAPRVVAVRPDEPHPYPGLLAFTEADAEHFFGREEEVSSLWRKIPERNLLALIGPSGAGKTSFLRAGMIPHAPRGWRCLIATPGRAPFAGLARSLAPTFAGEAETFQQLLDFHLPEIALALIARWRERAERGLIVIDQFEELFTLNGEDVQARFAGLLGRIAALDGVHVLLSMRDDFFFQCSSREALTGVFSAATPLRPLTREALRDALVKPARRHGHRLQDDDLVEEMLGAVEGERGALPLLAFAVARLWEERDRERKLLTREAYGRIGGVAGALAQHAEATLERIGSERESIVREIFRNLVTSQGTRTVVEAEELLSVFPEQQRTDARHVLAQLVDARLLTSFEIEVSDGSHRHRVEIVHESLLSAWPRLVRWRTEDEGSAQLRDQLRQAAHLWEEKGRPDDLLWTGTSYQEYQVWRARYPGGLSESEETFAKAMVARATHRRQVRRVAYAVVLAAVVLVASGLSVLLRKSVRETRRAEAAVAQREAAQLLALGRLKLTDSPKVALAYAIASIERADNEQERRFAVEALWQGPPALFLPYKNPWSIGWSPDGRWLALGRESELDLLGRDSKDVRTLSTLLEWVIGFTSESTHLVTTPNGSTSFKVWAIPEARLERTVECPGVAYLWLVGGNVLGLTPDTGVPQSDRPAVVQRFSLDGKKQEVLGRWEPHRLSGFDVDPSGTSILSIQGGKVLQQRLDALAAPPRVLGIHEGKTNIRARPWRGRVVTRDSAGELRIWDVSNARLERTLKGPADVQGIALDPMGRFVAILETDAATVHLFDLAAPRAAEPTPLRGGCVDTLSLQFGAEGAWLATACNDNGVLWNMAGPRSLVLTPRHRGWYVAVAFTPDGDLVSTTGDDGVIKRWFLSGATGAGVRDLWSRPMSVGRGVLVDAAGRFAVTTEWPEGTVSVVPLDGSKGSTHVLARAPGATIWDNWASLDPSGRLVAVGFTSPGHPEQNAVRILDLATGDERTLDTHPKGSDRCEEPGRDYEGLAVPAWLRDGRFVTDGDAGLRVWDLATGTSRLVRPCRKSGGGFLLLGTPDSRGVLRLDPAARSGVTSSLLITDLASGATREITSHGNKLTSLALDPSGTTLVTGDRDGIVRVGHVTGDEPRLLFGHTGCVYGVAVSPDGRTIASASADGTIRLWPMPDLSRPPLHTLPHDELLAKLKSLTNLRAVRDPSSDTGWKIEIGPFPGWARVPEWNP
jgi:serine/threonine protein kinase/WD40 repeat protein